MMNSLSGNLLAFSQQKRAKFMTPPPFPELLGIEIEFTIDGNRWFVNNKEGGTLFLLSNLDPPWLFVRITLIPRRDHLLPW
jgi:hypothetical protein